MKQEYDDITSRLGDPLWWDENGVPRYEPFSPRHNANIYADECALVEIACQACGHCFMVGLSSGPLGSPLHRRILDHAVHYGDPPNYGCCGSGPTMNSEPVKVVEYWRREHVGEWQRDGKFEVDLSRADAEADERAIEPTDDVPSDPLPGARSARRSLKSLRERSAIMAALRDGKTLKEVAEKFDKDYGVVRTFAMLAGWSCAWRRGSGKPPLMVGCMLTAKCVDLYVNERKPITEIGRMAGVTRERIRQVLTLSGVAVPSIKREKWAEARKRRAEEMQKAHAERIRLRKEKRNARYAKWVELWNAYPNESASATARRIGEATGLNWQHVVVEIHSARKRYGLFPRRPNPQADNRAAS